MRLEEIQGERDELHQNLVAKEMALQKMEKEKAMIIQVGEKSLEREDYICSDSW